MREEVRLRQEIVRICHKMYQRGFICAAEGNVSARLGEDLILITPSGLAKGEISPEELICVDLHGRKASGWGKASSETRMHLKVYEVRPDVKGVIHGHPPTAIAFTLAGISLAGCVIPEIVLTLGSIPTVPYATPGTGEAALVIEGPLQNFDGLLLDRHGTITVGTTLDQAFFHLERIEQAAQITLMARQLGQVKKLPPQEIQKIEGLRQQFGLRPKGCNECGLCK